MPSIALRYGAHWWEWLVSNAVAKAEAAAGTTGGQDTEDDKVEAKTDGLRVGPENFGAAFDVVKASITAEQKAFYKAYAEERQ